MASQHPFQLVKLSERLSLEEYETQTTDKYQRRVEDYFKNLDPENYLLPLRAENDREEENRRRDAYYNVDSRLVCRTEAELQEIKRLEELYRINQEKERKKWADYFKNYPLPELPACLTELNCRPLTEPLPELPACLSKLNCLPLTEPLPELPACLRLTKH